MKRIVFFSKVIFSLLVMASALSGCFTFVGYGFGSWIDNGRPHDSVAIFTDIESYTGQRADIIYRDSTLRNVTFESVDPEPESNYRKDYDQFVRSNPGKSAAIPYGDTILTDFFDGSGVFKGYCPTGILQGDQKIEFTDFDNVFKPKLLTGAELKMLFIMNVVPIRSTFTFEKNDKDFRLTNRDFQNVIILPHKVYGRWIGTAIGAAMDLTVIILIGYGISHGEGSFAAPHWNGGALH